MGVCVGRWKEVGEKRPDVGAVAICPLYYSALPRLSEPTSLLAPLSPFLSSIPSPTPHQAEKALDLVVEFETKSCRGQASKKRSRVPRPLAFPVGPEQGPRACGSHASTRQFPQDNHCPWSRPPQGCRHTKLRHGATAARVLAGVPRLANRS